MSGVDSHLALLNHCDDETEAASSAYTLLFLLSAIAIATYTLARYAEAQNRLNYDNHFARIIAGCLVLITRMLHSRKDDFEINTEHGALLAIGPHRTGLLDALAVATRLKGNPPRFFATDLYNKIPGVAAVLAMFHVIPVEAHAKKDADGRSANAVTLERASDALKKEHCIAIFPQGNFARIGYKPPRVYQGIAKLALENNVPIQVIRLDGFWSLQNPLFPVSVRNNAYYRAILYALHMNNIRPTLCCIIDFHLKPEHGNMSENEKIEEICAQLYAYFRHTKELIRSQINTVATEISSKEHLEIWRKKIQIDGLEKQLNQLLSEEAELERPTSIRMNTH